MVLLTWIVEVVRLDVGVLRSPSVTTLLPSKVIRIRCVFYFWGRMMQTGRRYVGVICLGFVFRSTKKQIPVPLTRKLPWVILPYSSECDSFQVVLLLPCSTCLNDRLAPVSGSMTALATCTVGSWMVKLSVLVLIVGVWSRSLRAISACFTVAISIPSARCIFGASFCALFAVRCVFLCILRFLATLV